MNELHQLGSPKQQLMAVLSKDNAIKEWFYKQTVNILDYRTQTSEKMSKLSNEIANPKKYRRRLEARRQVSNEKLSQTEFTYEEYDITKICSENQLPYGY
jgi:tRNA U54 and U55 pseudouridine synthase Pus10